MDRASSPISHCIARINRARWRNCSGPIPSSLRNLRRIVLSLCPLCRASSGIAIVLNSRIATPTVFRIISDRPIGSEGHAESNTFSRTVPYITRKSSFDPATASRLAAACFAPSLNNGAIRTITASFPIVRYSSGEKKTDTVSLSPVVVACFTPAGIQSPASGVHAK